MIDNTNQRKISRMINRAYDKRVAACELPGDLMVEFGWSREECERAGEVLQKHLNRAMTYACVGMNAVQARVTMKRVAIDTVTKFNLAILRGWKPK